MSSRKKNRSAGENNGSNRNLDGRRLRTVTEAKALAEYLAVKPEMEKKEKEERRRRWEQVVEATERREEEVRAGKGAKNVRGDGEWVEAKEEAEGKVREAVVAAVRAGLLGAAVGGTVGAATTVDSEGSDEAEEDAKGSESDAGEGSSSQGTSPEPAVQRKIFGWDEEDDEEDSEGDE